MEPAERIARMLVAGFDGHYRTFRATGAAAKERFESSDWESVQESVRERIRLAEVRVDETVERVHEELGEASRDAELWRRAKLVYIGLLVEHKRPELAETFFNSVSTRVLGRTYSRNDLMFVRATISTEYIPADPPTYRSYYPRDGDLAATFRQVLLDFGWRLPFADLDRDVGRLVRSLDPVLDEPKPNFQVRVLASAFYRNKAAYAVGKVVNGNDETPFAVAVVHEADGRLALDAALLDSASIDVLFSLSRAYFMADMDVPSGYVEFLQTIMPTKPRSELYRSLGLHKQGKTLFYRDLLHHLDHSQDAFVEAPGTRGQVMHVFTLPSYPYVFKVIRDVFGPGKSTSRSEVMEKFRIVKEVDRVGRMVDALEFVDLALPLARFSPALLEQLAELTPSSIRVQDGNLLVGHCYVERRMTPLDLYLRAAPDDELDRVVREYGDTLRELAIANVFPGDLLWRNFGLTRHGRVVCYDYDELEYLTDCAFREIPPPPSPEAELADEPWYPAGPRDVYPELLRTFLLGDPRLRASFLRHNEELLSSGFWRECQDRVAAGEVVDFFPYPASLRFRNRFRDEGTDEDTGREAERAVAAR